MSAFEDLISSASVRIYEYRIDRNREMDQRDRVLPFYVMSYISEGHAILKIAEREYTLGPNSVILVPPYTRHDHIMTGDGETVFWWWHFDYKVYDTVDVLKLLRLPVVFSLREGRRFEELYNRCMDAMAMPPSLYSTLHRKACIIEAMAHLLGEAEQDKSAGSIHAHIPHAFREMLETILSGDVNDLNLHYFSEKYNMHPTYISNRFSHYYGISPIHLHRRMQMERCAKLLAGGRRVGEVTELFGFSDTAVFSRLFTSYMGMSPSQYAKCGSKEAELF